MSPFELMRQPPSSPCRAAPASRARPLRETYWRSPFGTSAICSTPRSRSCPANAAISRGSSGTELRASSTPASSSLVEALGHRARLRRVEVDADRVHGQVGEALLEQPVRAAEGHPERELRAAAELLERSGEVVQAAVLGPRQERLLEHDELGVERVDLRLQDALGQRRPASTPVPWASANGDGSVTSRGPGNGAT